MFLSSIKETLPCHSNSTSSVSNHPRYCNSYKKKEKKKRNSLTHYYIFHHTHITYRIEVLMCRKMKQEHIKHHYVLPVTSFVKISSLNTTLIYFY